MCLIALLLPKVEPICYGGCLWNYHKKQALRYFKHLGACMEAFHKFLSAKYKQKNVVPGFSLREVMPPCYSYDDSEKASHLCRPEAVWPIDPVHMLFLTDPINLFVVWDSRAEALTYSSPSISQNIRRKLRRWERFTLWMLWYSCITLSTCVADTSNPH